MKATNCLFFTILYKETRGTFVPLHVTVFFYKICSVLRGGIQHLKKTCHGSQRSNTCERKRAIANMHSGHYVATRELRYFLAREIRERFRLIDKLTFLLFDTSLNHGVGGSGSLKNFLQALSLPSSP